MTQLISSGYYEPAPLPPTHGRECRYFPPDNAPMAPIPWPYMKQLVPGKSLCLMNVETGLTYLLGWHELTAGYYLVEFKGSVFGRLI